MDNNICLPTIAYDNPIELPNAQTTREAKQRMK